MSKHRDPRGRFSRPELHRETVTGKMMPGPTNAVLFRENDGLAEERVHRIAPDYNRVRSDEATAALPFREHFVNHLLDCKGNGC